MKRFGYRLLLMAIVILFAYLSARVRPPTQQTTIAPTEHPSEVAAGPAANPTVPNSEPDSSVAATEPVLPQDPAAATNAERANPVDTASADPSPAKSAKKTSPAKKGASTADTPTTPAAKPATKSATKPATSTPKSTPFLVKNVVIKDLDGDVAYRGDIDLTATLERIDAGRTLSFSHDGSTFQNRERRLPAKSAGYYREWVHPTPGLSGPGPQRVVTGKDGEAWYTHDHYRTFRKIR